MAGIGEIVALAKGLGGSGGGSSGGGVLVVHGSDDDTPVLDKTWKEIKDAWDGGAVVILVTSYGDLEYMSTIPSNPAEGVYFVNFFGNQNTSEGYVASSASGYPVLSE